MGGGDSKEFGTLNPLSSAKALLREWGGAGVGGGGGVDWLKKK